MSMQTIILLIAIGLLAGMLSGLVGIGGGIIIVPSLVFFLGFSQKLAQGTSLGVLLLPVGILAVWQFYKAGYVDVKSIWIISGAFLIGGFFGSKIALALPQETVKKIFGVFLLLIALKMIFLDKPAKANKDTAILEQLSSKHISAD
ncbi:MAG: hypothetical protein NVSMB45_15920 [Ginsengibacter sp.]